MSTTDTEQPMLPIPVEPALSIREITELLVRHHGLHDGIYDLMTQFHIGSGGVGPAPGELLPGLMIGLARIGLVKVPVAGPNSVDASQVNLATTAARKRPVRKSTSI
ncbi:MAG: hypothetical protein RL260_2252 [Pseudomonadota bacterium]|jgi:hypothetical protein